MPIVARELPGWDAHTHPLMSCRKRRPGAPPPTRLFTSGVRGRTFVTRSPRAWRGDQQRPTTVRPDAESEARSAASHVRDLERMRNVTDPEPSMPQPSQTSQQPSRRAVVKRAGLLGLSLPCRLSRPCWLPAAAAATKPPRRAGAAAGQPTATSAGVTINGNITPTSTTARRHGRLADDRLANDGGHARPAPTGKAGGTVTFARQLDSTLLDPPGNIINTRYLDLPEHLRSPDHR